MKILSKFKILPLFFLIVGGCYFNAGTVFAKEYYYKDYEVDIKIKCQQQINLYRLSI